MSVLTYCDLTFFISLLPQERGLAAGVLPQGPGKDTNVAGWIVENQNGNYEWEEDNLAPQTAQDYLDALVH